MGMFDKPLPADHSIYQGGTLVRGLSRPQKAALPVEPSADEIKQMLAEGSYNCENEEEFVAMLRDNWLPVIAPTLVKPITAFGFNSNRADGLGWDELLNVSTDYAGVAFYGLTLKNGYRLYLEIVYGDQFSSDESLIHPGGVVAGKRESNKRDREWITNIIHADSGYLNALVDSCPMSDDPEAEDESAPAAEGKYAKLFKA